jgi:urease accessory protein
MATSASVARTERENKSVFAARTYVDAELRLAFARDRATGQTVLAGSHQEPPLRVVRAFALCDGAALVHLHNVSGGLLGGDRLALTVKVGANAAAQITTTGATRIYRARIETPATTQVNEIVVDTGALLEYLPDAVIPFAGARFSQRTTIRLGDDAGLFWWDILAPGREARGEIFAYESVELRIDLSACGRLIGAERVRLEPEKRKVASLARIGAYRTWGTFYICRVGVAAARWLELESELREQLALPNRREDALWGVSTLTAHGLVARCVAKHGRDVLPGLQSVWRMAKLRLYGREAILPRKLN